jgi:cereblon
VIGLLLKPDGDARSEVVESMRSGRLSCRHCRTAIAELDASSTRHVFANPAGRVFEIVTVRVARLTPLGAPTTAHSWFPGFAWRVGTCPTCTFHLGWIFDRTKEAESFCGLILDEIEDG